MSLFVRWDESEGGITIEEVTSGRGRNRRSVLQIGPGILFNDGSRELQVSDLGFVRFMLTYPAESAGATRRKTMLLPEADVIATDRGRPDGCYELRFLDTYARNLEHLAFAWDSGVVDPLNTARETVYLYEDDSGGYTHHIGGSCDAGP